MKTIDELMLDIIHLEMPKVYSVELMRHDYATRWTAIANLRSEKYERGFSVTANSPVEALNGLLTVVLSGLKCPHCGQLQSTDKYDFDL